MTPVWTPAPPPPEAPSVDATRVKGAIAAALVLIAAIAVLAVVPSKSWYPSRWDPRIDPIATKVSGLRGLDFVHPVQVHFLTKAQFNKLLVGDGSVSASDRAEFATSAAVLRAFGLISGKVDLAAAEKSQAESDVAAFYSNDAKEVFVNGTNLDVDHRVTVAHELTHVLQDQHFDLGRVQKRAVDSPTGDTEAYRALTEGDAVRIQDDYVKSLSTADQREYARESSAASSAARTAGADVPDILSFVFEAPYDYGPVTVQVLFDSGGNLAVDNALLGPTPGSRILLEPGELDPPARVSAPELPAGATRLSAEHQQSFTTFELYPMLATTLTPSAALHAADLVDGSSSLTYSTQGKVCEAVNLVPRLRQSGALASPLRQWAKGRPGVSVKVEGNTVALTACDPGTEVVAPPRERLQDAARFLGAREGFTAGLTQAKAPPAVARCVARVVMADAVLSRLVLSLLDHAPTAAQQGQLRDAGARVIPECRRDENAGLH
jgi:hypothetical protein